MTRHLVLSALTMILSGLLPDSTPVFAALLAVATVAAIGFVGWLVRS